MEQRNFGKNGRKRGEKCKNRSHEGGVSWLHEATKGGCYGTFFYVFLIFQEVGEKPCHEGGVSWLHEATKGGCPGFMKPRRGGVMANSAKATKGGCRGFMRATKGGCRGFMFKKAKNNFC